LQYMYPRIDAEVSKRRNHLLKSPFVIHPGTGTVRFTDLDDDLELMKLAAVLIGRVCVPVEVSKVDDFEPTAVPTVGQLLRELDRPAAGDTMDEHDDTTKKAEPGECIRQG